jgi:hypothetical protein
MRDLAQVMAHIHDAEIEIGEGPPLQTLGKRPRPLLCLRRKRCSLLYGYSGYPAGQADLPKSAPLTALKLAKWLWLTPCMLAQRTARPNTHFYAFRPEPR